MEVLYFVKKEKKYYNFFNMFLRISLNEIKILLF